jgi:putative membrane protein
MPTTPDPALAVLHHLALLAVFGCLLAELALLRLSPGPDWVELLARIDLAYGIAAAVSLCAGIARVVWGIKGSAFYTDNPVFWLKLGLFVLIALISLIPTLGYLRWRRNARAQGVLPGRSEVARLRRWVVAQIPLFAGLPLLAVLMARGIGH